MPLSIPERNWIDAAERAAIDPRASSEGISIRIIAYLMRELIRNRDYIIAQQVTNQELSSRISQLELRLGNPTSDTAQVYLSLRL